MINLLQMEPTLNEPSNDCTVEVDFKFCMQFRVIGKLKFQSLNVSVIFTALNLVVAREAGRFV